MHTPRERVEDATIGAWLARLARPAPDPGGGAAAAVTLGIGAALVGMAAGYAPDRAQGGRVERLADDARARALRAADDDARASAALVAAFRLPADDPARAERLRATTVAAARSAVEVAGIAGALVEPLEWLAGHGEARLHPDVAVAARSLACAVRSSAVNVRCNAAAAGDAGADAATLEALRDAETAAVGLADELDRVAELVTAGL